MKRSNADLLVAGIAIAILLLGGVWSFQATQQPTTTMNGAMMDGMMNDGMGTYGTDPFVYVLAALLIALIVAGGYLFVRDDLTSAEETAAQSQADGAPTGSVEAESPAESNMDAVPDAKPQAESDAGPGSEPNSKVEPAEETAAESASQRDLLRYLPDDERRVLEPVIDSPGLTQIEIRDRSDFSKSKVSQTLSELEQRGLIYKETQGRTFRVYPGEELEEETN